MSFRTYEQQQNAIAAAGIENAKKQCLAEIYRQHPNYVPCMANDKMILEVIERYIGPEVIPTPSLFSDAIALNPDDAKFVRRPVARIKEQVIEQIMDALQSTNNLQWADAHNVSTERKKLSFWTVEQLRARFDQILEAQRLSKFSAGELREQLAQHRAAQQPGRVVLPAEITREQIRAMSSGEIKKLIRDYTASVVNDRLFGRS